MLVFKHRLFHVFQILSHKVSDGLTMLFVSKDLSKLSIFPRLYPFEHCLQVFISAGHTPPPGIHSAINYERFAVTDLKYSLLRLWLAASE
jgi:hypothetical protein